MVVPENLYRGIMNKPPVLVINSYGGSLTLAATQEGHPILASCEDHNFGLDSQRLNFPHLNYEPGLADWPLDRDLKGAMVIAHPPCSAFSSQNRGKNTRGPNAAAFACTTRLLEYAMPRRPEAIMIESVPGALEGARHVHDYYAKAHGYDVYRVLQNAVSFGVPQWRRRFWAIFVKQSEGRERSFTFKVRHTVKYLKDVLNPNLGAWARNNGEELDYDPTHTTRWAKQVELLKDGFTEEQFKDFLNKTEKYGNLIHLLADKDHVSKSKGWPPFGELHQRVVGGNFLSGALHVLDPNGFAPVLLGPAWWHFGDHMLTYSEYKMIMGFPPDYQYHKPRLTFVLLSKGVCPPVARWILRETSANVFGVTRPVDDIIDVVEEDGLRQTVTIAPGELADLRYRVAA
jgi:site-specific DNA-cytosine methylase